MNRTQATNIGDSSDDHGNNTTFPPETASDPKNNQMRNGPLYGFRVNNMDEPQASTQQVALYVDGAAPIIQATNNSLTEVITTHSKRESNYVHHGWSVGAIATVCPWTSSRIYATNRYSPSGTWVTRRTFVQRLRVRVLPQDLAPVQEFEATIKEALSQSTKFEKFRAVHHALDRWGDVVPLEIEFGSSLSLTDLDTLFAQLSATGSYNSLTRLSTIKTANIVRKGASGNTGWDDGAWTTIDVPATEWEPIRVTAVAPTLSLLSDEIQARLANLHNERMAYVPPLTIEPINWPFKMHDGTNNASRTISKIDIRSGDVIVSLSITYLDGVVSHGGGNRGGIEQTFTLTEGEHIVEVLTSADNEWLRAIQFITNKGRCSAIYGKLKGTPVVSRSEGGVLTGFSIIAKQQAHWDYGITGVHGIWRHDLIPVAPKETDVYSDYIGAGNEYGKGFNDRALIGNSSSIYITCVEVRAHGDIHSIEFTYTDAKDPKNRKFKAPRHGGSHGPYYRFDLEKGEHIVSVTGKYSEHWLTQLCFGTNLGRTSDVYGHGAGQPFSTRPPLGEDGKSMRLQYVIGRCEAGLNGVIFVWTPGLP
ncbi:hypothetical protein RSOLAG22IIIB_04176 [Rhizoctonia solani]|uniref:Jacalin-type lectin domain-containing protein n=1 Tax=Rhizoctonia solani TaxID=456999 RepID=A0A0K6FWA6_9AGAM|nr:hypothetical protein RSOLAG22IIIB_04176 [Rhizoctonia solani]